MMLTSPSKRKYITVLVGSYMLSACSATDDITSNNNVLNKVQNSGYSEVFTRIDFECEQQVKAREAALTPDATAGTYLALANHAKRCIDGILFTPKHPDNQTAMQFNALAVFNLLKAGELNQAKQNLHEFRQRFAQQDLVLGDYTSFVDTATALLNLESLSKRQVSLLNINPTLRAELARQHHWSAN